MADLSIYRGTSPTIVIDKAGLDQYDQVFVIFRQGEETLQITGVASPDMVACIPTKSQTALFNTRSPVEMDLVTLGDGKRILHETHSITILENHWESLDGGDDTEDLPLSYMEAIDPDGSEDPYMEGWYELIDGAYQLSNDRTVDLDKLYYMDPEELFSFFPTLVDRDDEDDVKMVLMDEDELSITGISPYEEGWYVLNDGIYSQSYDTSVVSGRDYYAMVDPEDFVGFYPDEGDEFLETFDGDAFISDNGYEDGDEYEPDEDDDDEWDESELFDVDDELDESLIEYYAVTPESNPKEEGLFEYITLDEEGDPLEEPYYEPTVDTTPTSGKTYYEVRISTS